MGYFGYRKKLRAVKDRLATVGDHPRLADEVRWGDYARRHQLRLLTERAVSLGA